MRSQHPPAALYAFANISGVGVGALNLTRPPYPLGWAGPWTVISDQ